MRVVVGWKGSDRKAASTSEMGRFETELLTQKDNLKGLERLNVEWVKRAQIMPVGDSLGDGGTKIRAGVVTAQGEVLATHEVKSHIGGSQDQVLADIHMALCCHAYDRWYRLRCWRRCCPCG